MERKEVLTKQGFCGHTQEQNAEPPTQGRAQTNFGYPYLIQVEMKCKLIWPLQTCSNLHNLGVLKTLQIEAKNVTNAQIACEQAVWGTLVVGREKEGELATTPLVFELHL